MSAARCRSLESGRSSRSRGSRVRDQYGACCPPPLRAQSSARCGRGSRQSREPIDSASRSIRSGVASDAQALLQSVEMDAEDKAMDGPAVFDALDALI